MKPNPLAPLVVSQTKLLLGILDEPALGTFPPANGTPLPTGQLFQDDIGTLDFQPVAHNSLETTPEKIKLSVETPVTAVTGQISLGRNVKRAYNISLDESGKRL